MLKNRIFRIVVGEISLIGVLVLGIVIVNLIPSKKSVENLSASPTVFLKLAETTNYQSFFKAESNNLNRVDVMFKNPNLESRDELELVLKDNNDKLIAKQDFSGFNLGDTSYARMDFLPINDSIGKSFKLSIIPTKIVDGKLQFGVKDNSSYMVEYYGSKLSLNTATGNTIGVLNKIWSFQLEVVLLPMVFWAMFLW